MYGGLFLCLPDAATPLSGHQPPPSPALTRPHSHSLVSSDRARRRKADAGDWCHECGQNGNLPQWDWGGRKMCGDGWFGLNEEDTSEALSVATAESHSREDCSCVGK